VDEPAAEAADPEPEPPQAARDAVMARAMARAKNFFMKTASFLIVSVSGEDRFPPALFRRKTKKMNRLRKAVHGNSGNNRTRTPGSIVIIRSQPLIALHKKCDSPAGIPRQPRHFGAGSSKTLRRCSLSHDGCLPSIRGTDEPRASI
jgi:hypothetical protein